MVLMNAGSRARYMNSITRSDQGGGNKKAGLPPMPSSPAALQGYHERNFPTLLSVMQMTLFPDVRPSRPISMRTMHFR